MHLEFIFLIIIIRFIRKDVQTAQLFPKWDKYLLAGMIACIALLIIEGIVRISRPVTFWIAQAMFFTVVYLSLYQKEFRAARPLVYAFLPLIVVSFFDSVIKMLAPAFHKSWENVFDVANIFSIVWMVAMLVINNKQRKALEKEKLKTQEKEKEILVTEKIKAELEVQVAERTAALTLQKIELQHALDDLKATQNQLIQSEKMASLGELTAGIAHEIQNPLNFVNNFSEVNKELLTELKEEADKRNFDEVKAIVNDVINNSEKINHHGKRADAIVKGMLQHSRSNSNQKEPTDINALADEYLRLAYHGLRAKDKSFNATIKTDYDPTIGTINVVPQDIGRVILNLITNAFYTVNEKAKSITSNDSNFIPTVTVDTKQMENKLQITVSDNGNGVPENILDKIFQPFFTTKPTGKGTGLGLSMSYDIITNGHAGELKVETSQGQGSSFIILLNTQTRLTS